MSRPRREPSCERRGCAKTKMPGSGNPSREATGGSASQMKTGSEDKGSYQIKEKSVAGREAKGIPT